MGNTPLCYDLIRFILIRFRFIQINRTVLQKPAHNYGSNHIPDFPRSIPLMHQSIAKEVLAIQRRGGSIDRLGNWSEQTWWLSRGGLHVLVVPKTGFKNSTTDKEDYGIGISTATRLSQTTKQQQQQQQQQQQPKEQII